MTDIHVHIRRTARSDDLEFESFSQLLSLLMEALREMAPLKIEQESVSTISDPFDPSQDEIENNEDPSIKDSPDVRCSQCGRLHSRCAMTPAYRCPSCSELLSTNTNGSGTFFALDDDVFFISGSSSGLPFGGTVVGINNNSSVRIRHNDTSWCFEVYDEIRGIDSVASTLDQLLDRNCRKCRFKKVERFADVQLEIMRNSRRPAKLGTSKPSAISFVKGQNIYFRNNSGLNYPGRIVRVFENGTAEVGYIGDWSAPKFNEVRSLGDIATSIEELTGNIGLRSRRTTKTFMEAQADTIAQEQQHAREKRDAIEAARVEAASRLREQQRLAKLKSDQEKRKHIARMKRDKLRERERAKRLRDKEEQRGWKETEHRQRKRAMGATKLRHRRSKERERLVTSVYVVNSTDGDAEKSAALRSAAKQLSAVELLAPSYLPFRRWVTDFVCDTLVRQNDNEHESVVFRPQERLCNLNVSIKHMTITEVLRRVRFVEGCAAKSHGGHSRLDRWGQRALCYHIFYSTQPHRFQSNLEVVSEIAGRRPRTLQQLQSHSSWTLPNAFPLSPLVSSPSTKKRPRCSDGATSVRQRRIYRHLLSSVDCRLLTVSLLERVLWSCPTTETEFCMMAQSYECMRSPMVPLLLEVIREFLELRSIVPSGNFAEIVELNKNLGHVSAAAETKPTSDGASSSSLGPSLTVVQQIPPLCPLCPQEVQMAQGRKEPVFEQQEFNFMKPKFPLSVPHFLYAMNLAYERCGGKPALEGCSGVHAVKIEANGNFAMYGRVNENLVQEIIERTCMSSDDVYSDLGCGIGQTCLQASAITGCRSFGYEIIPDRCRAARLLLAAFDRVLEEAGIPAGTMSSLVSFVEDDFITHKRVARDSTVIFFNNFSKWFDSDVPGKDLNYNSELSAQLLNLPMYAHVVTLNELVAAKLWLPKKVFLAPANANSWQLCENKRAPIYHYTKDSETWRCRVCRTHTPNRKTTRCLNGHATRIVRQASGDDSCSSYDRESSVADSSTIDSSSSSDSSEENDCGLEDDNCSVVVIDTVSMSEGIGDSSSFT